MDIKQAVETAKRHVAEVFSDEGITPPTLEEVEFDDGPEAWNVTVGFFRRDSAPVGPLVQDQRAYDEFLGFSPPARKDYKIVRISDKTGQPLSVKNRFNE